MPPVSNVLTLPLLPLTTGVVLPQMVVTLALETPEANAAADAALAADRVLLLVPRVDGRYAAVGTVARIEEVGDLPGGQRALVVRGLRRAVIGTGVAGTSEALWVEAEPVEPGEPTPRAHELAKEFRAVVESILEYRGGVQLAQSLRGITDPGVVADLSGYSPDIPFERKVEVLETLDVEERLEKVLAWARDTLAEMTLKDRIRTDVAEGMEKAQREFLLRQQLAAIRKELGETGDDDLAGGYRAKLAEMDAPEAVRTAVEREIDRLERTNEQSPEHGWIRTWLDWMTELPWGVRSEDRLDVSAARAILDADHTGLDDVKDRVVEHLAVRQLRQRRQAAARPDGAGEAPAGDPGAGEAPAAGEGREPGTGKLPAPGAARERGAGAILTLVGPPGVGKTSLGESVARAMGRSFVRVSLGGVRDEAEIRGHRRTYVGALPGRIVRAVKEAGTMNPVVLLDEVDKVGSDWRGDPASALLEVLDPAQNHTFRDHYLEVDLDLSDVVFLATANVADTIPGPLLDRMELIPLDGYTEDEKVAIARDHLLPRQVVQNGLTPDEVEVREEALRAIIADHTREAGVRNLERALGKVLRKVAIAVASGEQAPLVVDAEAVRRHLGRPRFFSEAAERTSVPGVATGLAVTGAGGDVLFVEATSMPGNDGRGEPTLTVTGQLGDVMKESAQIALSYVRSHAAELGLPAGALEGRRFHVHFPAGAVPKDGPSAGITTTAALVSLLSGRPVRSTVGMTGEITLRGRVLPIGGVKQKALAAHRAGLADVILPARNGPDLDDVPEAVREQVTFHLVEDIAEVLERALEAPAPVPHAA